MSKAIGIDLGTTNSVAGLKKLETRIIPNAEGDLLTPSVVALRKIKSLSGEKEEFVVGKPARQWLAQDPGNTIVSIKRLMGRHFQDPDVQRLIKAGRFAYTVQPLSTGSAQSVAVLLQGTEYTPEQISTKIIEKIKKDCEADLQEEIGYAVVTVPAYFNDKQTHMTRLAAARAGLKVQRLLPEPTAAAISFGVDNLAPGEARTILVFDLGGGTYDLSILTISDGQFIEQGKGGDMWMGGDDIDDLIQQYVFQQTEQTEQIDSLPALIDRLPKEKKNRLFSDLKEKVEAAKIQLSTREKTVIEVLGLLQDEAGDLVDIEVELTRARFEALLRPFADRMITLIDQVLQETHFESDLIDQVVMVGGSASIPLFIRTVTERFGAEKVLVHPRPMLAIAEGAAIMAHRLSDTYECPACGQTVERTADLCLACRFDLASNLTEHGVVDIVHTTSHDYFLELEAGEPFLLVPQHTPLPFATRATFRLVDSRQKLAHFKFFNRVGEAQESIGDLWLSFDIDELNEPGKVQPESVILDFVLDENNIITVSAVLKNYPEVQVGRTLSRGNVDEQLFVNLEQEIDRLNRGDYPYYVALEFLQRSVSIAAAINQVMDPDTGEANETALQRVRFMQEVAEQLVESRETPTANVYYVESFLLEYGEFIAPKERKILEQKLEVFRVANAQAAMPDILRARDLSLDALDEYPALGVLQDLDNAIDVLAREQPAQLPRLEKYRSSLRDALLDDDRETFVRLSKEIYPEMSRILTEYDKKKLHIRKEIRT